MPYVPTLGRGFLTFLRLGVVVNLIIKVLFKPRY